MQIQYANKKLEKLVKDKLKMAKEKGVDFAKRFYKRLDELKSFTMLFELMGSGLDNPHFLKGNLKNCIGWDIDANKRLILSIGVSPHQPINFDWMQLETVIIKGVVDYHGSKESWYIA